MLLSTKQQLKKGKNMKENKMKDSDKLIIFQKEDNDDVTNKTNPNIEKLDIDEKVPYPTRRAEWFRLLKFVLFSISAGVIQFVTFTLLSEVANLPFWPSHLIALALSVIWNFTFNRKFTFKSSANVPKSMLLAFLFYVPFTPATVLGGQALVNVGWNSLLVEAITMVLNFILEYFYSKYVTFRGSNLIEIKSTKDKEN